MMTWVHVFCLGGDLRKPGQVVGEGDREGVKAKERCAREQAAGAHALRTL